MRKLLNIIGVSVVLLATSCDMDKSPMGFTNPDAGFESIQNIEYLEKGAMTRLKGNYSPASVITSDIQADYVNELNGASNTYGDFYKWTYNQNTEELSSAWNSCYLTIGQCNFVLDKIRNKVYEVENDADNQRLEAVRGRLYLMRAMSYSLLAERFCAAYDEVTAKKAASGVPLIIEYKPDEKPGRASLYDIYDRIIKDLDAAQASFDKVQKSTTADQKLKAELKGSASATLLNEDCITALRARVYLQMDLYPEAYKEATKLISSPNYALASSVEEFNTVWEYDKGNEIIFKFAASKTELPPSYGSLLYYERFSNTKLETDGIQYWQVDFIPTQACVDSFEEGDYRKATWFYPAKAWNGSEVFWTYAGRIVKDGYTMIKKYPGNPDLRTDNSWNFVNTWKVFRVAEMYLIAAEAGTHGAGDPVAPMKALREHRGLAPLASVTLDDVKKERYKELMFEGTRLADLRRWGAKMERGPAQKGEFLKIDPATGQPVPESDAPEDLSIPFARELKVAETDFRFLWPIPFSEIYANQALASQQNAGWNN